MSGIGIKTQGNLLSRMVHRCLNEHCPITDETSVMLRVCALLANVSGEIDYAASGDGEIAAELFDKSITTLSAMIGYEPTPEQIAESTARVKAAYPEAFSAEANVMHETPDDCRTSAPDAS